GEAAAADEHAFGPAFRYLHLGRDGMVDVLGVRRRSLAYADGAWGIHKVRLPPDIAGLQCRIRALGEAIVEREHVVFGGLGQEPVLQLAQLLWLFGGKVVRLRKVLLDVV